MYKLSVEDRRAARLIYPDKSWAPDEAYLYPVNKKGRLLKRASRYYPSKNPSFTRTNTSGRDTGFRSAKAWSVNVKAPSPDFPCDLCGEAVDTLDVSRGPVTRHVCLECTKAVGLLWIDVLETHSWRTGGEPFDRKSHV
jgi:hypothetical protein